MKRYLPLILAICFGACAHEPLRIEQRTAIIPKPDAAPVAASVTASRKAVSQAQDSTQEATTAVTKVEALAEKIATSVPPALGPDAHTLLDATKDLQASLFRVSAQLKTAQDSLVSSEQQVASLTLEIDASQKEKDAFLAEYNAAAAENSRLADAAVKAQDAEAVWRGWAWRWFAVAASLAVLIAGTVIAKLGFKIPLPI